MLFVFIGHDMEYLHLKNWEVYQHYKKRNPPWIKLYHSLLDDYEYCQMSDDSKLLLLCFYMLASRTENRIPFDLTWIKRKTMVSCDIKLDELLGSGYIYISNGCNEK